MSGLLTQQCSQLLLTKTNVIIHQFYLMCYFYGWKYHIYYIILNTTLASPFFWIPPSQRKVNSNWSEHTWASLCCPDTSNSSTPVWKGVTFYSSRIKHILDQTSNSSNKVSSAGCPVGFDVRRCNDTKDVLKLYKLEPARPPPSDTSV